MHMKARANRREVTRWMLSASIGGLAAAKLSAGTMGFNGAASKVSFDPAGCLPLQVTRT
jgi:hypothetical protein